LISWLSVVVAVVEIVLQAVVVAVALQKQLITRLRLEPVTA
jgi:hypothetical protein